jgi:glycolate oxidase iron-sulfur subunit
MMKLVGDKLVYTVSLASYCIKCGFCEPVCPTISVFRSSVAHGPRGRVLLLRELYKGILTLTGRAIEPFFTCLNCMACKEVCPAEVDAGEVSRLVRKVIVNERPELVNPIIYLVRDLIMRMGNPLGLKVGLKGWVRATGSKGDMMLFTGELYQLMAYAEGVSWLLERFSNRPNLLRFLTKFTDLGLKLFIRNLKPYQDALKGISTLLRDVKYDPNMDTYSGILLYELGLEREFEDHANMVHERLKKKGIKKLVTIDPHTTYALSVLYPKYVEGFDVEVIHYLNLIKPKKKVREGIRVTYQDPCYLTRFLGNKEGIRAVLEEVKGIEIERVSHGTQTSCCGGPIETLYPSKAREIAKERLSSLKVERNDIFVTACPVCMANFRRVGARPIDLATFNTF